MSDEKKNTPPVALQPTPRVPLRGMPPLPRPPRDASKAPRASAEPAQAVPPPPRTRPQRDEDPMRGGQEQFRVGADERNGEPHVPVVEKAEEEAKREEQPLPRRRPAGEGATDEKKGRPQRR